VPPDALMGQVIQKPYLTNEKELEHSESGPLGLCGGDKAPWPLSWVLFQVLRREKSTRPHVGSKVEPAVSPQCSEYCIIIIMYNIRYSVVV
jgi:hypothetical protein